jgi:dienelactone hydrolase
VAVLAEEMGSFMSTIVKVASIVAAFAWLAFAADAHAGQEFPPPQGKGRIVMMASGMSGPDHYTQVAKDIAALGYDVVLFDGNAMEGTHGAGVVSAMQEAAQAPHGLPGKMALVGFSLGGGMVLYYGAQHSDVAAGAVVWYPANAFIKDAPGFAGRLAMPLVMFAGEADHYRDGCCTADKDRELAAAAIAAGKSVELTTYPGADHDFVKGGAHYQPKAYADALQKTATALKAYFGE